MFYVIQYLKVLEFLGNVKHFPRRIGKINHITFLSVEIYLIFIMGLEHLLEKFFNSFLKFKNKLDLIKF